MEGMISKEILKIQGKTEEAEKIKLSVSNWGVGLVTKLMEVTHGQWLYRNVHVHDAVSGEKAMNKKEAIRKELEVQMMLDEEGLVEEDQYLLRIKLDELDHSTGEEQAIWLMALRAARKAQKIREDRSNVSASGTSE